MYQFVWLKEALNYLNDNIGLVDELELAFADLRKSKDGIPRYGIVDKDFGPNRYSWTVYKHIVVVRRGIDQGQPKLWVEAIKPVAAEDG